jgi:hypothetical protein
VNRQDLTNRALALRALRDLVTAEEAAVRQQLATEFTLPGQREVGHLDGHITGTVQLIKGTSSWVVDDYEAWLQWVIANRPDEVVPSVRPSFTKAILNQLKKDEAPVDHETGELEVPAGILPKSGAPSIRVTPTEDATKILLQLLGDHAVTVGLAEQAELEAS